MRRATPAIEFQFVTKRFGNGTVLNGLTFDVPTGSTTILAGPNGCGKSTAIAVLAGWLLPNSGNATINGRAYRDLPHPARYASFQSDLVAAHPLMTAKEALTMLAYEADIDPYVVDHWIGDAGLTDAANRQTGEFSLGMKRRLGIAAAFMTSPDVVVMDEPTNGLDDDGVHWFYERLQHHRERGGTALIASHHQVDTAKVADRIVRLADGRLMRIEQLDEQIVVARCSGPDGDRLARALRATGDVVVSVGDHGQTVTVHGRSAQDVAVAARDHDVLLVQLQQLTGQGTGS